MKGRRHEGDRASRVEDWGGFMDRVHEALGPRTQIELASLLGIRQSSISDAKRRGTCPAEWQMTFVRLGLSPDWLLTGKGPKHVVLSEDGAGPAPGIVLEALRPIPKPEELATRIENLRADVARLLPGHGLGLFVVPASLEKPDGTCLFCGGKSGVHGQNCPLSGRQFLPDRA